MASDKAKVRKQAMVTEEQREFIRQIAGLFFVDEATLMERERHCAELSAQRDAKVRLEEAIEWAPHVPYSGFEDSWAGQRIAKLKSEAQHRDLRWPKYRFCNGCNQPVKPGRHKPGEYEHAQGCPGQAQKKS